MSCFQPFALVDVKHVVITQEGNLFLFAVIFVFLLDPFPEHDHAALFALTDVAACGLNLLEGDIFTGTAQQHLVEQAVGLARCVADAASGRDPRLFPRDNSGIHLFHDPVGNFLIKIHFLLPFSCKEQGSCGRTISFMTKTVRSSTKKTNTNSPQQKLRMKTGT